MRNQNKIFFKNSQTVLNIIDYYFKVSSSPTWTWFTYNADKVLQSKSLEEEDMAVRKILRQKAKGWMEN